MKNESVEDILNEIMKTKGPLKKLILEYIPHNFQLKLYKSSRAKQDQYGLSFTTYKYYSLLKRKVPIDSNPHLKFLRKQFTFHHIDFCFDKVTNMLLLTRICNLVTKSSSICLSEVYKAIEIYLLDYHVPYLFLSTPDEYKLFQRFRNYFKETMVFCILTETKDFFFDSFLTECKEIKNNILYLNVNKNSYCSHDFPNLQYLTLTQGFEDIEIKNFNYLSKRLLWGKITLSSNASSLQLDLNNMKHLSIQLSGYSRGILDKFNNESFNELISLSLESIEPVRDNNNLNRQADNRTIVKLDLTGYRYPKLKHLSVKLTQIILNLVMDETIELDSLELNGDLAQSVKLRCVPDITLLNIKDTNNQEPLFKIGNYDKLTKLKLSKAIPLPNVVFTNVTRFHFSGPCDDAAHLKSIISMIREKLISLTLDFEKMNDANSDVVYSIFFANFPNLNRIKVVFPLEREEKVFKYMKKYVPFDKLTTIKFIFHKNCPDSVSQSVVGQLFKYPLPKLEVLSCINILEVIKLFMLKDFPLLRKLEMILKQTNDDIFDTFDEVYPFFLKPHPKLESLKVNNKRFHSFVNYSLRKFTNLYSYQYDNANDGFKVNSPSIMRNTIFDDPVCIIF